MRDVKPNRFTPPTAIVEERQPEQLPAERLQPSERPHRLTSAPVPGGPSQRKQRPPTPITALARTPCTGLPRGRDYPEKTGSL